MPEVVEPNQTKQSAVVEKYTGADVRRNPHEEYSGIPVVQTTEESTPAASRMSVDDRGSLTPAERAELESIMLPAQIEAIEVSRRSRVQRRAKAKKDIPELIAANAEEMMVEAVNKRFYSAKGVATWLVNHGLHEPVRVYSAFGAALGRHGLNLPSMTVKGRRYSDLACIGWIQEQKRLRQSTIDQMGNDVRHAVIAD
jgi:hypothetical protein